ncbi:hypothetical protein POM88_051869 [Heracleum sosnowskyi]|uniref:Helicase C-terminal domain-containing protein n=1 Tax=Heracleum sosnowskyi TaxID=360622 RepID=A0AAD8GSN0_9APIA|nr:hypothetical protein POM88_051869 [Heracleum sosnowskyi]
MEVERVCSYLTRKCVPTIKVHGGLAQRETTLDKFKGKNVQVLVITPKLLRGLLFKFDLLLVNYDLPPDYGEYKQRIMIAQEVVTFLNQESPRGSVSKLRSDKDLRVPELVRNKLDDCRAEIVWGIKPEKEIWDH